MYVSLLLSISSCTASDPTYSFQFNLALLILYRGLDDNPPYPPTQRHIILPFVVFRQTRGSSTCIAYISDDSVGIICQN
ncbi:hypothetical protein IW261DRAFT_1514749 [Armillaria novae-zelandiae]|uniref:Uncharacterized protein n=1 Tax=Armillaria novae-zelandiae TaxID=153914 RepID=A0AA39NS22_9AGAR|nr:hypothetical protein IW261DRAFT_1514749 [Armillaria novae-zelandiae]